VQQHSAPSARGADPDQRRITCTDRCSHVGHAHGGHRRRALVAYICGAAQKQRGNVSQKLPCSRFFSRCRDLRPIASPPTCCDSVVEPVAGRIRRPSRRNDTPGAKRLRVRIRLGRRLLSQGHRVHLPTPRGLPAWTRWRCLECERRFRPSRHRCRPRLKRDRQSWSSAPCG
jgi:hypothetical protein